MTLIERIREGCDCEFRSDPLLSAAPRRLLEQGWGRALISKAMGLGRVKFRWSLRVRGRGKDAP
jgi:hypothetical protein